MSNLPMFRIFTELCSYHNNPILEHTHRSKIISHADLPAFPIPISAHSKQLLICFVSIDLSFLVYFVIHCAEETAVSKHVEWLLGKADVAWGGWGSGEGGTVCWCMGAWLLTLMHSPRASCDKGRVLLGWGW